MCREDRKTRLAADVGGGEHRPHREQGREGRRHEREEQRQRGRVAAQLAPTRAEGLGADDAGARRPQRVEGPRRGVLAEPDLRVHVAHDARGGVGREGQVDEVAVAAHPRAGPGPGEVRGHGPAGESWREEDLPGALGERRPERRTGEGAQRGGVIGDLDDDVVVRDQSLVLDAEAVDVAGGRPALVAAVAAGRAPCGAPPATPSVW